MSDSHIPTVPSKMYRKLLKRLTTNNVLTMLAGQQDGSMAFSGAAVAPEADEWVPARTGLLAVGLI